MNKDNNTKTDTNKNITPMNNSPITQYQEYKNQADTRRVKITLRHWREEEKIWEFSNEEEAFELISNKINSDRSGRIISRTRFADEDDEEVADYIASTDEHAYICEGGHDGRIITDFKGMVNFAYNDTWRAEVEFIDETEKNVPTYPEIDGRLFGVDNKGRLLWIAPDEKWGFEEFEKIGYQFDPVNGYDTIFERYIINRDVPGAMSAMVLKASENSPFRNDEGHVVALQFINGQINPYNTKNNTPSTNE